MREFIQQKLEEIQDIEITPILTDDIIEEGKTYFCYYLGENHVNNDLDRASTYRISITGFIKRKEIASENTIEIIDNAKETLKNKFKEINIAISFIDIETIDNIRKARGNGTAIYNELTYRIGG